MATLLLQVKKPFYDEIENGTKKIDYRDCNEFWINRLIKEVLNPDTENESYVFTEFDQVKFLMWQKNISQKICQNRN